MKKVYGTSKQQKLGYQLKENLNQKQIKLDQFDIEIYEKTKAEGNYMKIPKTRYFIYILIHATLYNLTILP